MTTTSREKIHNVGNVMIDSLIRFLPQAERHELNGLPERFALVTLHRPSNVDDGRVFRGILKSLLEISERLPIVFPVHTRTRYAISAFDLDVSSLHLLTMMAKNFDRKCATYSTEKRRPARYLHCGMDMRESVSPRSYVRYSEGGSAALYE